ncbi:hypothetical protein ACVNIS_11035 [Sphaerotilaceae bacterium SBD11-9]
MSKAAAKPAEPVSNLGFEPLFALSTQWAESLLQLQRLQIEACVSWQKALTATGQELYDEWACRFAGGAPIDG